MIRVMTLIPRRMATLYAHLASPDIRHSALLIHDDPFMYFSPGGNPAIYQEEGKTYESSCLLAKADYTGTPIWFLR